MPRADGAVPAPGLPLRRGLLVSGVIALGVAGFLYFVLPQLAGLDETWQRIRDGDPWWLGLALCLELISFGGYVLLLRAVLAEHAPDVGWRRSYEITMAGVAATRLFATAGAGGIALTAWALRQIGMTAREVTVALTTFLVAVYSVYMASLVIAGVGLRSGLFPGAAPFGMTVVPAIFAACVIAAALALALVPGDLEERFRFTRARSERARRGMRRLAVAAAAVGAGTRGALVLLRSRERGLLGAAIWWGFDVAVLWACFEAFGDAPEAAVLVMGYFTGMLANTLPLPGGVGAVEGGMIGAFIAFGVAGGLALVAVLAYRVFAFWMPTLPGALAFVQLRRAFDAERST